MLEEEGTQSNSVSMASQPNWFCGSSLLTTDNCLKTSIIGNFGEAKNDGLSLDLVSRDKRTVLVTIDNLLDTSESNDIIAKSEELKFQDLSDKYSSSQRNNSRLLVLDDKFAPNLWGLLAPEIIKFFEEWQLPCQPLGFAVSNGCWKFEGLNEAFRINKYTDSDSQFFSPHKDSQYCPNGDCRSLLTLVIYLNEDFDGGSTCFYFPKDKKLRKDVSIEEEIQSSGGLDNGYTKFVIKPSIGKAVIFSQDILHESVPVTKGTKYILKTDIMVKRVGESLGFVVPESEQADYIQCLNYFREAQQQELQGNSLRAGELYERALSIRYCYPMNRERFSHSDIFAHGDYGKLLPALVWHQIFNYLSGIDRENIIKAFPNLRLTHKAWERYRYIQDERETKTTKAKYIPRVEMQYGIYTKFDFDDADFFWKNEDGCLRVAAIISNHQDGNINKDNDEKDECKQPADKVELHSCGDVESGKIDNINSKNVSANHVSEVVSSSTQITPVTNTAITEAGNSSSVGQVGNESCLTDIDKKHDDKVYCYEGDSESENTDLEESDTEWSDSDVANVANNLKNFIRDDCDVDTFYKEYDGQDDIKSSDDILQLAISHSTLDRTFGRKEVEIPDRLSEDQHEAYEKFVEDTFGITYSKAMRHASKSTAVSVALISSLKKPTLIETNSMCLCYWPGGDGFNRIRKACRTIFYNHLVFDFLANKMVIHKDKDHQCGVKQCYFIEYFDSFINEELNSDDMLSSFQYCIDVKNIIENTEGFNHASCQCYIPAFKITEYCNLKSYPSLNHIHLVGGEKDGHVFVWAIYGGIAAL
eukprot:gene10151-11188_t